MVNAVNNIGSNGADLSALTGRVEIYVSEAQRLTNEQKYSEACNFLDTAAKLILLNNLENKFGGNQVMASRNDVCEMHKAKNQKELKETVDKLNAFTNSSAGRLFLQDFLGCRTLREECLRTSNYDVCIAQRAPSCR
jgi:hypothetical protein